MNRRYLALLIPLLMLGIAVWLIQSGKGGPRVGIATLAQLPMRITAPYDEKADANAAVDAAFARARLNHKRVLIDLGGNWCPDCVVLANVMTLSQVKPWLDSHFEIVAVDVGRFDRNLQVPARFGLTERLKGVPTVLIVRADGKLLNDGDPFTLANATAMTPQAIVDWFAKWTNYDVR